MTYPIINIHKFNFKFLKYLLPFKRIYAPIQYTVINQANSEYIDDELIIVGMIEKIPINTNNNILNCFLLNCFNIIFINGNKQYRMI